MLFEKNGYNIDYYDSCNNKPFYIKLHIYKNFYIVMLAELIIFFAGTVSGTKE